jgi:hypothetical protein
LIAAKKIALISKKKVQRNGDDADENSLKTSMHLAVPTTFNHKLSNHEPIQWYC